MFLVKQKCDISGINSNVWIIQMELDKFMCNGHGVAKLLGYKNPHKAIRDHVKPQWRKTWVEMKAAASSFLTPFDETQIPANWQPNTVFITEAGVYALIMRSKLPTAEMFREWLFEEVLPQMRRTKTLIPSFKLYNKQHVTQTTHITQYVYMITSPIYKNKHIYKIGTTTSPKKRLRQLNCGRPYDLLVLDYCEAAADQGYVVEALMLNEYKTQQLHGEWVQFADNKQYLSAKQKLTEFVKNCNANKTQNDSSNAIQSILNVMDII